MAFVHSSKALFALCLAWSAMFASTCAAAEPDPNGRWKFTLVFPIDGGGEFPLDVVVNMKADGDKLTGKISGPGGDGMVDILDGTFKKGTVAFRVVDEAGTTSRYKGKIEGDKIKGTMEADIPLVEDPLKLDWNAERDKEKK